MNYKSICNLGFLSLAICIIIRCRDARAQTAGESAGSSSEMNASPGVIHHGLHLPQIRVHDPWILAYAPTRTYYLYTSNFGRVTGVRRPGTMAYRSKDLLNWEGPLVVFALPDGTWAANQPAWAPEVHEYKNQFYLFTTLHNTNKIIAA